MSSDEVIKPDTHTVNSVIISDDQIEETDAPVEKTSYGLSDIPFPVYFIIVMELMERYAYYGLRSVLTMYLKKELKYSDTQAKSFFSLSNAIAYIFPILGAFLADEYLNKYWTILLFGIFYVIGSGTLSLSGFISIDQLDLKKAFTFIGLFTIAISTGGIKPNVGPTGAEQLRSNNTTLISTYFSIFYICINVGSLASTFLTPVIRDQLGYSYAFLIPSCLLVVAICIFAFGKKWYYIVPASGSLLKKIVQTFFAACRNRKMRQNLPENELKALINPNRVKLVDGEYKPDDEPHFFDLAKLDPEFKYSEIEDCKTFLTILPITVCFPLFWCAFNQQATTWVLQADQLDRHIFGVTISAEHMQCLNAFSILAVIPILETVYNVLRKFNLEPVYLTRICVGMFVAGFAYIFAAFIDWQIADRGEGVVSIAYQIVPYVLMAFAEGLVSVSALALFFSKAPPKFKSTVTSVYNLTNAGGDIIAIGLFNSLSSLSNWKFSLVCSGSLFFNGLVTLCVLYWFNRNVESYKILQEGDEGYIAPPEEISSDSATTPLLSK